MLENQFVRFTSVRQAECIAVPIVMGYPGVSAIFRDGEEGEVIKISLMVDGKSEPLAVEWESCDRNGEFLLSVSEIFDTNQMTELLKNGQCFYLKLEMDGGIWYSNTLQYYSSFDGLSVVKYRCLDAAFGFPFDRIPGGYIQATLPILLSKPQYGQEDKTYVKANGDVVVLYSNHFKEWEAETEYIPEEWHDKLIAAISCDEVYVNNERVTKSASYSIDWENPMITECGVKAARATFKMRANTMSRNSNF